MNESMLGTDIWVKYTPKKGDPFVSYHRVWSLERFMTARAIDEQKTGTKAELTTRPPFRT